MSTNLIAALEYAKKGIQVFPCYEINPAGDCACGKDCTSPGKHPRTRSGVKEATTDTKKIIDWWTKWPQANVAGATGSRSGIVVVDVDAFGEDSLDGLETPETAKQLTGSGEGFHLIYRSNGIKLKSKAGILEHVDSRAEGGYIILAPSNHITGNSYEWEISLPESLESLPYPPQWFIDKTQKTDHEPAFQPGEGEVIPEGGRNDWLASVGGKLRKKGHDQEEIEALLAVKNRKHCSPPLSKEEVQRIAMSVSRYQTGDEEDRELVERGGLIASQILESHKKKMLEELQKREKGSAIKPPKTFLPESGILREIMLFILSQSRIPNERLAFAAGVSFLGALFGRKWQTETGLQPNLYTVGVAPSGTGKEAPRKGISTIATAAEIGDILAGDSVTSGAAILAAMQQTGTKLFQFDEFGRMLKSITGEKASDNKADVMTIFMKLYSAAGGTYRGTEYADQKARPRVDIHSPIACIFGTTTPESFYSSITSAETVGGELARMIIIDGDIPRRKQMPSLGKPMPELIQKIKKIYDYTPGGNLTTVRGGDIMANPEIVYCSEGVLEAWEALEDEAYEEGRKNPGTSSIMNRIAENTMKLALILAVSRDWKTPHIGAEDFLMAKEIITWSASILLSQIGEHMAENKQERYSKKLEAVIKGFGKAGGTKSDITYKTRFLSARERNEMLEELTHAGIVICEKIDTDGAPKFLFFHQKNL